MRESTFVSDSVKLVDEFHRLFPHLTPHQTKRPLGKTILKLTKTALTFTDGDAEPWIEFWREVREDSTQPNLLETGWLWQRGNLGMLLRTSTFSNWDAGQYRARVTNAAPSTTQFRSTAAPGTLSELSDEQHSRAQAVLDEMRQAGRLFGRKS